MLSCGLYHEKYEFLPKGEFLENPLNEEETEASIFQERYPITWSVLKDKFISKREFNDISPSDNDAIESEPEIVPIITLEEKEKIGFNYSMPTKRIGGGFTFSAPQSDASFALSLLKVKIKGKSYLTKGVAQVVSKKRDINTFKRKKSILAKRMLRKKVREIPKETQNSYPPVAQTQTSVSTKIVEDYPNSHQNKIQGQMESQNQFLVQNKFPNAHSGQIKNRNLGIQQNQSISNSNNTNMFGQININRNVGQSYELAQQNFRYQKQISPQIDPNQNVWGEQNIQADPNLLIPPTEPNVFIPPVETGQIIPDTVATSTNQYIDYTPQEEQYPAPIQNQQGGFRYEIQRPQFETNSYNEPPKNKRFRVKTFRRKKQQNK